MNLDNLKEIVELDINNTKEYDEFLQDKIGLLLTEIGKSQMEQLHFFNLGFLMAMEKIQYLLEQINVD